MKNLKSVLNEGFSEVDNVEEMRALYLKIWKKDIITIADILKANLHDPEMLLKLLAGLVTNARSEGYPNSDLH